MRSSPILFIHWARQTSCHHRPWILRRRYPLYFSTTSFLSDNTTPNHYEVLKLTPSATAAEIKKQFYTLSKITHPDANPDDSTASSRFSQVSESYSVLSDPERRRRYDRDHLPQLHPHHSSENHRGHSGSYAGSRPASGLSKRRGTFRGPPPSFYAQGAPRRAPRPAPSPSPSSTSSANNAAGGGFGPGGATSNAENDVPHFNREATYRTQSSEDVRRNTRRAAAAEAFVQATFEEDRSFWVRFVVVSSIILGTTLWGTMFAARRQDVVRQPGQRVELSKSREI